MKIKVIKGLIIGLIIAGIGVTGVCLIRAKHTAEAKQEEILLCKEETKWYYRTENGVLQKRQWSLTYGKWMSEWTDVAGTEIPGQGTVEVPSHENDKVTEKTEGLLKKSDVEIRNAAFDYLDSIGLNATEWYGTFLMKSTENAVLLFYPPQVKVTQTDSYADIISDTDAVIFLHARLGKAGELNFSSIKVYGVSQAGVYEMGTDVYIGIVYKDKNDSVGLEAYGMAWYRYDKDGGVQRLCTAAEQTGLYTYWKNRKPVLYSDGSISIYNETGEETNVSSNVYLSGMIPCRAEYGVSGPELIRMIIQDGESREDFSFVEGFLSAEVTDFVTNGDTMYFVGKRYGSGHAAGFASVFIGAMNNSGMFLPWEVYHADRSEAIYLQTVEENYGQYGADYLVLSTETEYQGLVSSEKQVFRTDETGFVQTWITRENGHVYVIDYDVEQIPIDETYFSGELFREYIKREIDTNGDGLLTKKEREQVRSINFDSGRYRSILKGQYTEKKAALDGLNWFPNLERLELMSEAEVYLYQHPSITVVNWNESGSSLVFAEDCDKLEQIDVFMSSGGAVYAKNCKKLKWISDSDGSLGTVYMSETPNCFILDDETLLPPKMPESRVEEADADAERIPVSERYFSGSYFRGYIEEMIDTDKDGFLTKQEREQVTAVDFEFYDNTELSEDINVVDGLNWFPNMEYIGHMGGRIFEIILDQHPGVKYVGSSEAWRESYYYINGCEKLEGIWFDTNGRMRLYVNDCKNLASISGKEFAFSGLCVSGCPEARFYMSDTIGFPDDWYIDDDVQLVWAGGEWDTGPFDYLEGDELSFTGDGHPYLNHGVLSDGIQGLHWLGTNREAELISEHVNKILTVQNNAVPKELLKDGKVTTEIDVIMFSPKEPSVYSARSSEKDSALYWEFLAKNYFIAESDGTVVAYDSWEELSEAAKEIEGLGDISGLFDEE
ncbi:MAG: hypothetical protein IKT67_12330 [Lachnospiraceae bacterium]|nr:hypothetical protein [Lachnospiraceae bacterium]